MISSARARGTSRPPPPVAAFSFNAGITTLTHESDDRVPHAPDVLAGRARPTRGASLTGIST
jgi:hypothetical protein